MSERINALSLIRAFGTWCEVNHLHPMDKLLWYELWQLFNRLGWPEWVAVDLLRLSALIGKREATVIEHRDSLISKGLLGYQRGKKGVPSRYCMNFPTLGVGNSAGNSVGNSVGHSVGHSVGNSVGETATINRLREKQDKDKVVAVDGLSPREATELAEQFDAVLKAADDIGLAVKGRKLDEINSLCAEYTHAWVLEAIARTSDAAKDARNWRYVGGILKAWREKGGMDSGKKKAAETFHRAGFKFVDRGAGG